MGVYASADLTIVTLAWGKAHLRNTRQPAATERCVCNHADSQELACGGDAYSVSAWRTAHARLSAAAGTTSR